MHQQRRANNADRSALEHLWLTAFPEDTPADVAAFWESGFSPEQAVVYTVDDTVVSMAFLLPAALEVADGLPPLSAGYVFAAATLPQWRGQGLFSALMQTLHTQAAQAGMDAVFLRPAQPSLEHFYARFGYSGAFQTQEITLTRAQVQAMAAPCGTAIQQLEIPSPARQLWLQKHHLAVASWGDAVWRYAVDNAHGGRYWESQDAGWMALCAPPADHFLVRELLCDTTDLPDVYHHLCREYRFSTCTIRRPAQTGEQAFFGMLKPLNKESAARLSGRPLYMGPALD